MGRKPAWNTTENETANAKNESGATGTPKNDAVSVIPDCSVHS
jgi:hypothetical protein